MDWSKRLKILGLILLLCLCIPIKIKIKNSEEHMFKEFVIKYDKNYINNETEYAQRFQHFKEALIKINKLNSIRPSNNAAIYGITKFSDLSPEEFKSDHLRRQLSARVYKPVRKRRALYPTDVDWRKKGLISAVKNQQNCGACWAFSTIETVETMRAIKNGTLTELSVQQLIDCAGNGNEGCSGGDNRLLLEWLFKNQVKIKTEREYPYTHMANSCQTRGNSSTGVQITNFACDNFVGAEDSILQLLATHGPVTVAVNAINWQYYLGGVIQYHCTGDPSDLNHAVQLVGYSTLSESYYIARNSWGVEFGDAGYLYLHIGTNICGLANEVCTLNIL